MEGNKKPWMIGTRPGGRGMRRRAKIPLKIEGLGASNITNAFCKIGGRKIPGISTITLCKSDGGYIQMYNPEFYACLNSNTFYFFGPKTNKDVNSFQRSL